VALGFGATAFRDLFSWLASPGLASQGMADLLFEANTPPIVAFAIGGALLARELAGPLPRSAPRAIAGWSVLSVGVGAHAWSALVDAPDLLLLSAIAYVLGVALVGGGLPVARRLGGPLIVLALAVPWPASWTNHVVWVLQLATTRCAAWLLELFGGTVLREGISLVGTNHGLLVVETCSGLGTIRVFILVVVAFSAYERAAPHRAFALLLFAPAVAFILNAIRVALLFVADREVSGTPHAMQGLAVFSVGALVLVAIDSLVSRMGGKSEPRSDADRWLAHPTGPSLVALAGLTVISVVVPSFDYAPLRRTWAPGLPASFEGARPRPLPIDPIFWGNTGFSTHLFQRYDADAGATFVLLAHDDLRHRDRSLSSPKHSLPGARWELVETLRYETSWGGEFTVTLGRHGTSEAFTAFQLSRSKQWMPIGIRSFLALDRSPLVDPDGLLLTKVVSEVRSGPGGRAASLARVRAMLERLGPWPETSRRTGWGMQRHVSREMDISLLGHVPPGHQGHVGRLFQTENRRCRLASALHRTQAGLSTGT
jgi:exosortase